MLVLTRRANQSIMIGQDVIVTVLEVRGDQVRIGISAPRSVDVHREEVFAEVQKANKAAASRPPGALEALGQALAGGGRAAPAGGGSDQAQARPGAAAPGGDEAPDGA